MKHCLISVISKNAPQEIEALILCTWDWHKEVPCSHDDGLLSNLHPTKVQSWVQNLCSVIHKYRSSSTSTWYRPCCHRNSITCIVKERVQKLLRRPITIACCLHTSYERWWGGALRQLSDIQDPKSLHHWCKGITTLSILLSLQSYACLSTTSDFADDCLEEVS